MRTRAGSVAEANDVAAQREALAKLETPRALIGISVLVMLLSAVNFVMRPEYFPVFHVLDCAAALVMLAAGFWLRRPTTPPAVAPWLFSACMVVLAGALLAQAVIARDATSDYVLLVLCLTGPIALAWPPFLTAAALITVGVAVTTASFDAELTEDWTVLAITAAMTGGVILWLRLGSIEEQVRASRALAEESRRLGLVLAASRMGVWDWYVPTGEMVLDERWAEILGYRLEDLQPVGISTGRGLMHPEDRAASDELVDQHLRGLIPFYEIDLRMRHRDGHWVWVRDRGTVVERSADGTALRMMGTHEDVTDRKRASEELLALATHDPLTGLANRASLLDDVARALRASRRSQKLTAVLMLDLDNFKFINDTLGHRVGDELLQSAARRIESVIRAEDLVARPGGDEFVVVVRDLQDDHEAFAAADRLLTAFKEPLVAGGRTLFVTASIGVAIATSASRVDDLVREADTAMYVAKSGGRDRIAVFSEDLRAALTARVGIEHELRNALAAEDLAVYYQPEVDLVTGRVVAAEALLRWNHADGTTWTADRFIDIAEDTGMIREIGAWVLRTACRQAAEWTRRRPEHPVTVRVNVSTIQLGEADFLTAVDDALTSSGVDPSLLCLEITETTLLRQTATARSNLAGIRERGVHLALDDFGTGYASLTYLRQFPIDLIKIDRSFVTHVTTEDDDRSIVAAIIALAGSLSIAVTAEGVESVEQAVLLRRMGCPTAQGFLYSRAVPAEEATALLERCFATEVAPDPAGVRAE